MTVNLKIKKKKHILHKYQHKDFIFLNLPQENICKNFEDMEHGFILWDFFTFLKS